MKVLNYKEFRVTDEMLASKTKRFVNFFSTEFSSMSFSSL